MLLVWCYPKNKVLNPCIDQQKRFFINLLEISAKSIIGREKLSAFNPILDLEKGAGRVLYQSSKVLLTTVHLLVYSDSVAILKIRLFSSGG